jgi:translocation and assembly module TamB
MSAESNPSEQVQPELPGAIRPEMAPPARPSRLRRFLLRHLPLSVAGVTILAAVTLTGLFFWASSAGFENMVRRRLVSRLETATGGRVEIASFHWNLLYLEADAGGLVIHGREEAGEVPYARANNLRVRISVLGFLSPKVLLRDLDVDRPALHLIVYKDGSTNQPQPRKPKKAGEPAIDTFFNLKAGHVAVHDGTLVYENRAASFDFQDRLAPLDFDAHDVSLLMSYVPAAGRNPESYRIEAGAVDLSIARAKAQPVRGYFQATLDLTRTAAYLRFLRITSKASLLSKIRGAKDHTLEVSGALENFAHPHWQAKAVGELDMKLLEPTIGYNLAPEGIARLDLNGVGQAGMFRADGSVHVEGGSYIGTGVVATGLGLDARVHADPQQLLVTSIVARLRQGGQLEGSVALEHWLPPVPGAAEMQPSGIHILHPPGAKISRTPIQPVDDTITIPINGKVSVQLRNVTLDTLLDMVGEQPFQRLGLDALINGPADATWVKGDVKTLSVVSILNVSPSGRPQAGEVATSGIIDGTYTQRDGAVDLRKLVVHTPASEVEAHGKLGAYPLASPSAMFVDFHSHNLGEFDTILRKLGLSRKGKTGVAALPVTLAGQADFHGSWAGSLSSPRIAGDLKATQIAMEMPALPNDKSGQPKFLRWDTAELIGSYSEERIAIEHGLLRRGKTEITLDGALAATPAKLPAFDANSQLRLRLRATKVGMDDLLPLTGENLPVTGSLDAQLDLAGPLHAVGGSGWVELDGGTVWGQPVSRIRAQGSFANQQLKLASLTVAEAAGKISATGSYDMKSRRFQVDAKGAGIDVASIEGLRKPGLALTGKLGFTVAGSGTLDDPRLEGHASTSGLAVNGEPMGAVVLTAHTANKLATYDATSRLETAELVLHGQTALSGEYATQAGVQFSRFDIGALLKLANVKGLSGESSLAGSVNVAGPLAKPEQMRGEARLQDLEVTVSGVHLHSQGGLHATMANGRVTLDPLHVTGEQTDLHTQGSLSLKGKQQLDFAASGSVNLKLVQTLDPDLTAGGTSTFQVEAHGPLNNPGWQGQIDLQGGSLAMEGVPNGLSQIHGTLEFNQNRLEVKSLTAMSGGGLMNVGGYLTFQHGLYVDLSVNGKGIRIRYPQGVSSQADATLRLQGSQNNLLLSGNVLVTRFTVSPDLDIAALATQANSVQSFAPPDAPSNHFRLDVHLQSSPQLNFQNAYAKLAGNMDLRLRGTLASPSLLGRVSITEGSALIAGTRYELEHGDVFFTNPIRIQPSLDLNASAHVEDYDITLGLHGTLDKPTITYRSDPPLPEADVVALLALGRTESQQRLYTQQQLAAGANPTTDALLGGALNATVSSRVQKLFGAGSVKVDPNYLGALGNSTSRIIVEEQLGRNLTLTYATNVNTTGQQLIQAEVAINRHVSLLVARDESGVFSMVIKATRRYK